MARERETLEIAKNEIPTVLRPSAMGVRPQISFYRKLSRQIYRRPELSEVDKP
jgi:hypothetical protein